MTKPQVDPNDRMDASYGNDAGNTIPMVFATTEKHWPLNTLLADTTIQSKPVAVHCQPPAYSILAACQYKSSTKAWCSYKDSSQRRTCGG